MIILTSFAFLAGIVTVLSPCVLPVLPIILSSSMGGAKNYSRPFGVIVGFVLSFTFFTLFLSSIVKLLGVSADLLRNISVLVILGFGISLLLPFVQKYLEKLFALFSRFVPQRSPKIGFLPGVVLGMSLGLLWTPCVGPILASVISLAIVGQVTFNAFLITLAYSLGTAIPMFLIMIGGQKLLSSYSGLVRRSGLVQKIFGVVMIATALAIYFNFDRTFQSFVLDKFPGYGTGLTKIEQVGVVQRQLEKAGMDPEDSQELSPKAPEIVSGGPWFNSDPLLISELKGKVVLVDFWTYSCINCQRTFPYLRSWWDKYNDKGLVIIGVHSPEFEFEKNPDNVQQATSDFGLDYPIVMDNDFSTWRAYSNRYWPAKYLIDKDGFVRYTHFGEGAYDQTERMIQQLLQEAGAQEVSYPLKNLQYSNYAKTPETYLGYGRANSLVSVEPVLPDEYKKYTIPARLPENTFALEGNWLVSNEYVQASTDSALALHFAAKSVYLVMNSEDDSPKEINVYLDDVLYDQVIVTKDTLYEILMLEEPGEHTLRLEFLDPGVRAFAFTFG